MSTHRGLPAKHPRGAPHVRARHQRGFSAILMIGLIVLVAGMLSYAVTVTSATGDSTAREIAAARVAQAAQSGLEWGQFRVRPGAAPVCAANSNITIPLSSGNIAVTVRCTANGPYTEAAATVMRYQFTATACRPAAAGACPNAAGSGDYVEAQVVGMAER